MFNEQKSFGQYEITGELGEGAQGKVYKVQWTSNRKGTIVGALKFLNSSKFREILNEVSTWARVSQHPNILTFITAGEDKNRFFIISEIADEGDLDDWINDKGGNEAFINEAVNIMIGVLAGLDHLHENDVIHRDIKPANILLHENTPILADFGLARSLDLGQSSILAGTQAFMSPELFEVYFSGDKSRHERTEFDDLWAVAGTFQQMLTGQRPFKNVDAIRNCQSDPLPTSVPIHIQAFFNKAFAKNISERFQNATDMREALEYPKLSSTEDSLDETEAVINADIDTPKTILVENFSKTIESNPKSFEPEKPIIPPTQDWNQVEQKTVKSTPSSNEPTLEVKHFNTKPEQKSQSVVQKKQSASLLKGLAILGVLIAISIVGYAVWSVNQNSNNTEIAKIEIENKISKKEMELLLKDFPPLQRKEFLEKPEKKKELINNLKELFAIATQAQKDGYTNNPLFEKEAEFIKKAIYATYYDKKINLDKDPMPPFGYISDERVKQFWDATDNEQTTIENVVLDENTSSAREIRFQQFLDTKLELARKSEQIKEDQNPTEEEIKQAKDNFAKTEIYYNEVMAKLANIDTLPKDEQKDWKQLKETTEIQVKLQNAQFITQNYVRDVLNKKFEVTDEDINKYLAEHPELNIGEEKKKIAEEILQKIKDGGDFSKLAKEFSEDPGSKDKGGLYEGVAKGQFAPEFEAAVLALEPSQVADKVVKTNFGYHIIKLEKKGEAKDAEGKSQETYDTRHILFSTMIKDPDNPAAREQPLDQFLKSKLEKEKQEKTIKEIVANNSIEIAEDFDIPEVTEEEIKQAEKLQKKSTDKPEE